MIQNAANGGEWILQERMLNAPWLSQLLPHNSPLSTMRIITTSTWSLHNQLNMISYQKDSTDDEPTTTATDTTTTTITDISDAGATKVIDNKNGEMKKNSSSMNMKQSKANEDEILTPISKDTKQVVSEMLDTIVTNAVSTTSTTNQKLNNKQKIETKTEKIETNTNNDKDEDDVNKYIKAVSCVLRLGRADAKTDHSSVLFDVDMPTGRIHIGTTNHHWYKLGLSNIRHCPWLSEESYTKHPDSPHPEVAGQSIPEIQNAIKVVTTAHMKLMPDVPIVGWDVAFTPQGIFLLEVNLSCNFFKGKFNMNEYMQFVHLYFIYISAMEEQLKL